MLLSQQLSQQGVRYFPSSIYSCWHLYGWEPWLMTFDLLPVLLWFQYRAREVGPSSHTVWHAIFSYSLGFFKDNLVDDLLRECTKMQGFDHRNVLTVLGVCLDGGPAPYIVMPFMTNGCLLTHLKNNRNELVLDSEPHSPNDIVSEFMTILKKPANTISMACLLRHCKW